MSAQPASVPPSNPFRELWDLGYTRLVPVVPPGADLSEKSSLAARARAGSDERGKAPGVKRADGLWTGLQFTGMESQEQDLDVWNGWGASVGIKTGDGLIALDIDTTNKDAARNLFQLAAQILGPAFVRFGRHPKCLMLYEAPKDTGYKQLRFSTETEDEARLEILSEGRQFVARGIHPKTGKPYTWPQGVPRREGLTRVSSEQIEQFLKEAAKALPNSRIHNAADDRQPVDQEDLRAPSWEALKATVEAVPNMTALFPSRDDYVKVAYAVKAACPEGYEHDALELYLDWCGRWDGGENDPDIALADWNRAKPPFRVGFSFLQRHAASLFFQPVEADPLDDLFAMADTPVRSDLPPLEPGRVDFDDLKLLPPRQWLYGYKVSRGYVTFVASPGGVGKTAWVTAAALACCKGEPLLHDKPVRPLKVWLMNLEDDRIEMLRRIKAAVSHYGLDQEVFENLRINSGRDRRFIVAKQQGGEKGSVVAMPDYAAVIEVMRREAIDILIVDPYLRSHSVSENSTEGQDEVMRLYTQIAHETKAGVILVHHFKKGGAGGDMDSMRGSSTQGGSARSVLTLTPMSVEEAAKAGVDEMQRRLHVRIDDAKNNMAPPMAKAEWIKLHSVSLGNGDETYPEGDKVQVATEWKLPGAWDGVSASALAGDTGFPTEVDMVELEALKAIDRGPADAVGERFAPKSQAGERWVGNLLVQHFGRSKAQAVEILRVWEKKGWIENVDYMSAAQRKTRKGVAVVWDKVSANLGVFD